MHAYLCMCALVWLGESVFVCVCPHTMRVQVLLSNGVWIAGPGLGMYVSYGFITDGQPALLALRGVARCACVFGCACVFWRGVARGMGREKCVPASVCVCAAPPSLSAPCVCLCLRALTQGLPGMYLQPPSETKPPVHLLHALLQLLRHPRRETPPFHDTPTLPSMAVHRLRGLVRLRIASCCGPSKAPALSLVKKKNMRRRAGLRGNDSWTIASVSLVRGQRARVKRSAELALSKRSR